MTTYTVTTTTNFPTCKYCTGFGHTEPERCPRVSGIEYDEDGRIKKITFHPEPPAYQPLPYSPPPLPPYQPMPWTDPYPYPTYPLITPFLD